MRQWQLQQLRPRRTAVILILDVQSKKKQAQLLDVQKFKFQIGNELYKENIYIYLMRAGKEISINHTFVRTSSLIIIDKGLHIYYIIVLMIGI